MLRYICKSGFLVAISLLWTLNVSAQDSTAARDTSAVLSNTASAVPAIAETALESPVDNPLEGNARYFTLIILVAGLLVIAIAGLIELSLYKYEQQIQGQGELHLGVERLRKAIGSFRKWFTRGLIVGAGLFFIWFSIKGTPMEGHVMEWMNLVVRWGHVVFAMAWIGASFYFIFLENSLNRKEDLRDELAGNLWAVHGGGFYYVEKYKSAPPRLPKKLHWFKWEAYITWISGFTLLFIVYYFNAQAKLVDPAVADISSGTAILIGLCTLGGSWLVYDLICRTPIAKQRQVMFWVMFAYITLLAFVLSLVFSSRGAYIHVGAVIGTLMAGNVFFNIIPAQHELVSAAEEGRPINDALGKQAGLRSLHNNYFTLPVIFIMISNHFPSTYGNVAGWAILAGLTLASAGVKHYFNLKDQGKVDYLVLPISVAAIIALALVAAPRPKAENPAGMAARSGPVRFHEVYRIMTVRCQPCHSASPTDEENVIAPNGVMYDTPEQIVNKKDDIMTRAVLTKTMPQANKTNMTEEERETLRLWIEQGAKIEW